MPGNVCYGVDDMESDKGDGMAAQNQLSENLEDYLEVILALEKVHKVARAKDIAERLKLQRGSVTSALKTLAEKGLINYTPYSFITLTPAGTSIAKKITGRHAAIKAFLIQVLQIDPPIAEETACRMEHAIDEQTLGRLACFSEYISLCPRAGEAWIQSFIKFCADRKCRPSNCRACIDAIEIPE
jgi:DtxR family transcriptional regulator, Mn-dependent transcriptional regulator